MDRTIRLLMNRARRANLLAATNPGSRKYRERLTLATLTRIVSCECRASLAWCRLYRDAVVRSLKF
jgi:hypothetical protein